MVFNSPIPSAPLDLPELMTRTNNYVLTDLLNMRPNAPLFAVMAGSSQGDATAVVWVGMERPGGVDDPPERVGVALRPTYEPQPQGPPVWDGRMSPVWNTSVVKRLNADLRGARVGGSESEWVAIQVRNYLRAELETVGSPDERTFYSDGPGWPYGLLFGNKADSLRSRGRQAVVEVAADLLLPQFVDALNLRLAVPEIVIAAAAVLPQEFAAPHGPEEQMSGTASAAGKAYAYTVIAALAGADRLLPRGLTHEQRIVMETKAIVLDGSGELAFRNALYRAGMDPTVARSVVDMIQRFEMSDVGGQPAPVVVGHSQAGALLGEAARVARQPPIIVPSLPVPLEGTGGVYH